MPPGPHHIAEQETNKVVRKDIMAKRGMWDDMCKGELKGWMEIMTW